MVVADAVVKRALVGIALAEPVTPGKYLLLFGGGVAEVEEALGAGLAAAASTVLDKLFLPKAADELLDALNGNFWSGRAESIGIVEAQSVAATILAADRSLKQAAVHLKQLHLARGIGGKGYFVLTGELHMVQAALAAAQGSGTPAMVRTEIVERPHGDLKGFVF
jgi:microcompartment protein CcmL/EutN